MTEDLSLKSFTVARPRRRCRRLCPRARSLRRNPAIAGTEAHRARYDKAAAERARCRLRLRSRNGAPGADRRPGRAALPASTRARISSPRRKSAPPPRACRSTIAPAMPQALPYPDASFDVVRAERLLIYLKDWGKAVSEMKRVAKPGASLAFIEPEFGTTTINLPDRAVVRRAMAHEADTAVVESWLPGRALRDAARSRPARCHGLDPRRDLSAGPRRASISPMSAAMPRKTARSPKPNYRPGFPASPTFTSNGRLFGSVGYFLFTARA